MSTRLNNVFAQPDDPRQVQLIESLVEKTRQGKIPWVKQANAFTAMIPGGFQINFVLGPMSIIASFADWQLLTVRDRSGSELVKVSNSSFAILLTGAVKSSLVQAADELFRLVNGAAGDDLDQAINTIKRL